MSNIDNITRAFGPKVLTVAAAMRLFRVSVRPRRRPASPWILWRRD